MSEFKFCPQCRAELAPLAAMEDGGEARAPALCRLRLHPLEQPDTGAGGRHRMHRPRGPGAAGPKQRLAGPLFGLITGFMEAGESPRTASAARLPKRRSCRWMRSASLLGVWEFKRLNQIIIAYAAQAHGEIRLSPELAEYKLLRPSEVKCWPQGTG